MKNKEEVKSLVRKEVEASLDEYDAGVQEDIEDSKTSDWFKALLIVVITFFLIISLIFGVADSIWYSYEFCNRILTQNTKRVDCIENGHQWEFVKYNSAYTFKCIHCGKEHIVMSIQGSDFKTLWMKQTGQPVASNPFIIVPDCEIAISNGGTGSTLTSEAMLIFMRKKQNLWKVCLPGLT